MAEPTFVIPAPLEVPCGACLVCAGRVVGDVDCAAADPDRQMEAAQVALANVGRVATAWRDTALKLADTAKNGREHLARYAVSRHYANILAVLASTDPKELLP